MKEKRNKASRGHGGVVYVRGLSESLAQEKQRKLHKKLARINARPHRRITAGVTSWLQQLARRVKPPVQQVPAQYGPPVETLNG